MLEFSLLFPIVTLNNPFNKGKPNSPNYALSIWFEINGSNKLSITDGLIPGPESLIDFYLPVIKRRSHSNRSFSLPADLSLHQLH